MSMTVITVQQIRTQPFRKRITVPLSDLTTQAWWDRQVDPSTSVRLLILEEARNHGLVDRMNRIGTPAQAAPTTATTMPQGPTVVPNPTAQPKSTAASGSPLTAVPTAATGPSVSSVTAVPPLGQPSAVPDARDIEIQLLRTQLDNLQRAFSAPPLFHVA